jgi:hypothetical protein
VISTMMYVQQVHGNSCHVRMRCLLCLDDAGHEPLASRVDHAHDMRYTTRY